MKYIGYLLMLAGLVWASWFQIDGLLRASLRPVVLAQYAQLSPVPGATYTTSEVQLRIRETALASYRAFPHPLPPCLLVLVGAFLARQRHSLAPPNNSSKPTPLRGAA